MIKVKEAPKRGRPKATPEGEPRRHELVLAAYRRVAETGFEGLRTRDVASEVGVNIATLHYYFRTKEALIRAVVDHAMGRFRTTLEPGGSPGGALEAHFRGVRRLFRDKPELFAVMGELAQRSARDPVIAAIFKETNDAWHATLRGLLRQAQAKGVLHAGVDPDATAALVTATFRGMFMLPSTTTTPQRIEQSLTQLEQFLGINRRGR
ncbi:MAG: TetR/AcrR family transcriptional regulator [Candidatus Dormibacteraeota bacterium]|nr:TetR/AcrR family transcriptional regulator [Candidatus Dormibacteraeota bacterium]